jgi:putative membrane protein
VLSTATTRRETSFARNRLLQLLAAGYLVVWIVTAIHPLDFHDGVLENLLAVSFVAALAGTYRVFPLSDLSYSCIFMFLILHAVGAHYTYAQVPVGFWARDALGLERNHFDRLVHFSFGLLMAYPIREVFLRVASTRGFWTYYLPLDVTLAFSAVFEIFEWAAASAVPPGLRANYLGMQGDPWDAQKDMLAAGIGALVCMLLTAWASSRRHRPRLLAGS